MIRALEVALWVYEMFKESFPKPFNHIVTPKALFYYLFDFQRS